MGNDTNEEDESTVMEPESSGMTIDDLIGSGEEDFDLDEVLEKISKSGMDSLTAAEKQFLNSLGD